MREGQLIVGGNFETAGPLSALFVAAWDGNAWSALGAGLSARVNSLAVFGGDIYAGGEFIFSGSQSLPYIGRWDGNSWHTVGDGVTGGTWPAVNALTVYEGDLIAGGGFIEAGGLTVNHLARWDGAAWHALGDGVDDWVWAVTPFEGDLIAGGYFTTAGSQDADHIAAWDGAAWHPLGAGLQSAVRALAESGGDLYIGGDFIAAGGQPSYYIGRWNTPVSCLDDCAEPRFAMGSSLRLRVPSLWQGPIRLRFELPQAALVRLTLHDVCGRRLATLMAANAAAGGHELSWQSRDGSGRALARGVYFLRLQAGAALATRRVVVTGGL